MDKIIKILVRFYPVFLKGLGGTLWLAAATVLFGTVLGLVIAILRMSRIRVFNAVAGVYIEILRGTPILLQLYFFWLMLPKIMPFDMTDTAAILVALIINASAYISEIIRAGIAAVDPGQWEAARSLASKPAPSVQSSSTASEHSRSIVFAILPGSTSPEPSSASPSGVC